MSDLVGAYVSRLMNEPWERSGLHCWKLVRQTVRDLFGVRVPLVMRSVPHDRVTVPELFAQHPERDRWEETAAPGDWAIALMARRGAAAGMIEHAGVYLAIDGGGILHCDDPHGVVFDSPFLLPRVRIWAAPTYLVPHERA